MVVPNVPVGYIFDPTERELMYYLLRKAIGQPLPCNDAVIECDLYGQVEPMDLFAGSEEEVVYVFTKLKKKSENSSRIERKVAEKGTWSGVDNKKPVMDGGNRYIGWKRNFVYVTTKGKDKTKAKAGYNMKEYKLLDSALNNEKVSSSLFFSFPFSKHIGFVWFCISLVIRPHFIEI